MHNFTASPPNHHGVFSPQTSVANFCEIDYEVTIYIAEFINTLSNFAYIYLSFTALAPKAFTGNPLRWPAVNIALFLVGIGSGAFHATLKHHAQMADELSMYAIITTLNYRVYTYKLFTSLLARTAVALVLLVSTAVVAYTNITSTDGASDTLHLVLFVTLITTFWPRVLAIIYSDNNNHPTGTQNGSNFATGARKDSSSQAYSEATRQRRLATFRRGGQEIMLGFGLWLIDGLFCDQLRAVRAVIGLPLAWFLELHGAWHILTAMAAATFVRLVDDLTL